VKRGGRGWPCLLTGSNRNNHLNTPQSLYVRWWLNVFNHRTSPVARWQSVASSIAPVISYGPSRVEISARPPRIQRHNLCRGRRQVTLSTPRHPTVELLISCVSSSTTGSSYLHRTTGHRPRRVSESP
jgi:hypothetical protein